MAKKKINKSDAIRELLGEDVDISSNVALAQELEKRHPGVKFDPNAIATMKSKMKADGMLPSQMIKTASKSQLMKSPAKRIGRPKGSVNKPKTTVGSDALFTQIADLVGAVNALGKDRAQQIIDRL